MKELNKEQEKVVKADISEQILVNASPGTGKTYTVAKKIEYILKKQIASAEQILVICFSRTAVKEIKDKINISEKQKAELTIRTIDSFCSWVIKEIEENQYKQIFNTTTYDARIQYTLELLQNNSNLQKSIRNMKHIIIDEVQDIVRNKGKTNTKNIRNLPIRLYPIRRRLSSNIRLSIKRNVLKRILPKNNRTI